MSDEEERVDERAQMALRLRPRRRRQLAVVGRDGLLVFAAEQRDECDEREGDGGEEEDVQRREDDEPRESGALRRVVEEVRWWKRWRWW